LTGSPPDRRKNFSGLSGRFEPQSRDWAIGGLASRLLRRNYMLAPTAPFIATSLKAATAGRLRYVSDTAPGITRIRSGRGFRYRGGDGKAIRDPQVLARIRALAIPPAWSHVWICAISHGHIQAVGRDARGRKQYRYHLRNTPSICRTCYIHPAVIEAYQDSTLVPPLTVVPRGARRPGLQPAERAVLRLLKTRRAAERSVARRVTR
jgi:DNA topoisomerase IB